ncbi:MAG TPA: helix-turn-helix domain-containing protein [Candidatus Blautia merdipullorum]|nr:helix-turn-helix domain-containing protein [Candidatus Blautia merdipullorum]
MLKIREYRKQQNLTMKELAQEAGMSISYISQVERGEIDPSLSSLRRIASVLQVPLYLLLDDMEIRGNLTLRKEQQLIRCSEDGKVLYRFLSPLPSPEFSPQTLLIHFEVAPHAQDVAAPIRHHSEESIYVTEGTLTVQIGETEVVLNSGDSTVIEKDFPHICKNTGDVPVKGISAISPPVWGRMDLVR